MRVHKQPSTIQVIYTIWSFHHIHSGLSPEALGVGVNASSRKCNESLSDSDGSSCEIQFTNGSTVASFRLERVLSCS
eukprot:m.47629 g.47629  ORF g.47629 m.47629 type:complete len:77 (+) comp10987_c0_seq2:1056-1286(+)